MLPAKDSLGIVSCISQHLPSRRPVGTIRGGQKTGLCILRTATPMAAISSLSHPSHRQLAHLGSPSPSNRQGQQQKHLVLANFGEHNGRHGRDAHAPIAGCADSKRERGSDAHPRRALGQVNERTSPRPTKTNRSCCLSEHLDGIVVRQQRKKKGSERVDDVRGRMRTRTTIAALFRSTSPLLSTSPT